LKFLDAVQGDTYDVVRIRKNDEEKAIALIQVKEWRPEFFKRI
jgi:hypothetical protein